MRGDKAMSLIYVHIACGVLYQHSIAPLSRNSPIKYTKALPMASPVSSSPRNESASMLIIMAWLCSLLTLPEQRPIVRAKICKSGSEPPAHRKISSSAKPFARGELTCGVENVPAKYYQHDLLGQIAYCWRPKRAMLACQIICSRKKSASSECVIGPSHHHRRNGVDGKMYSGARSSLRSYRAALETNEGRLVGFARNHRRQKC